MIRYLEDAIAFIGAVLLCVGVALYSIPAGLIAAGICLICAGVAIGYGRNR